MEPNVQPNETKLAEAAKTLNADTTRSGAIVGAGNAPSEFSNQQWQDLVEPIKEIVLRFPGYANAFYSENKELVNTIGLFILAGVGVKLTLAILDAVNDIPLLAPLMEIIGLGYTIWFVYRYVWKAESRVELKQEFDGLKKQVMGESAKES